MIGSEVFIGVGTVASNKELDSNFIMVNLNETFPLQTGEIDLKQEDVSVERKTLEGDRYKSELKRSTIIKAEWFGSNNKLTSPDVKRGELVYLYSIPNSDVYKWKEHKGNAKLRRTERSVTGYVASGKKDEENIEIDSKNQYMFETNTGEQHITLTTSKDNGEYCSYTFQLNTKTGSFTIEDSVGNLIQLDSKKGRIVSKVKQGTFIDINKDDITLSAKKKIKIKAEEIELISGEDTLIKAGGNISLETKTVKFSSQLKGPTSEIKKITSTMIKVNGMLEAKLANIKIVNSSSCK